MRTGDWICTFTGAKFFVTDPHPDDVFIEDIAHALSFICRYGGHCREFYSVAQHSFGVWQYAVEYRPNEPRVHAWALLHDAAEAYLGDMVRPLKLSLPEYKRIEEKVELVVISALGFDAPTPEERAFVKYADDVLLMTERRDLLNHRDIEWTPRAKPRNEPIVPWDAQTAKWNFLHAFRVILAATPIEVRTQQGAKC